MIRRKRKVNSDELIDLLKVSFNAGYSRGMYEGGAYTLRKCALELEAATGPGQLVDWLRANADDVDAQYTHNQAKGADKS